MKHSIAAALFGFSGLMATAARAGDDVSTFDVQAGATLNLTMTLCAPLVDVEIVGDGDTDLDFYIYDSTGELVFFDEELSDWTNLTVEQPANECREYDLEVINYGDVYNRFRVILDEV